MTTNDKSVLDEIIEMHKALSAKTKKHGEKALKDEFKKFFKEFPEVESIVWTQYSPHFNDGDACTFSVNPMELKLKPLDEDTESEEDEEDDDDEYDESYGYGDSCHAYNLKKSKNPRNKLIADKFYELVDKCEWLPDMFEELFGNSAIVTATLKGFEVDHYSHD